jgi:hypothetical protein
VEAPGQKTKKDRATVTPPLDTGNSKADAPVDKSKKKKKALDAGAPDATVAPVDTQQNGGAQQNSQKPIDKKASKKDAGASDQQPAINNAAVPAGSKAPTVSGKKKKKNAEPDANTGEGAVACDPKVQDCPPSQ